MNDLNVLERAVLQKFLEGDEPALIVLQQQLKQIDVANRETTGAGFYTTFLVPPGAPRLPGNRSLDLSDVVANIAGLKMGAGFLLFVRDGLLHQLEGYSYGNESWPPEVASFEVGYLVGNQMAQHRDLEALRNYLMHY